MKTPGFAALLCSLVCFLTGLTLQAQTLEVTGEVKTPLRLTADDFKNLPHEKVKAKDKGGVEGEFEGIPLHRILAKAGVPSGEQLRGPAISLYVLVTAADGYAAVFSLPELDPAFTDDPVLLADAREGKPLDAQNGPLRLILPGEKRHARWVRQVVKLEVIKAPVPELKPGAPNPYK